MGSGEIEVLEDLSANVRTRIAGLIEGVLILWIDCMIVIRAGTYLLDLADVEHRPEEAADTFIMIMDILFDIGFAHVLEEVVDAAEEGPAPTGHVIDIVVVSVEIVLSVPTVGIGVAVSIDEIDNLRHPGTGQRVGINHQRVLIFEEILAFNGIGILLREEIVAGCSKC